MIGSRQERIDPDQWLLYNSDERKRIVEQSDVQLDEDLLDLDEPSSQRRKCRSHGRAGQLSTHLERTIFRQELSEPERFCPWCGETRAGIAVESSE